MCVRRKANREEGIALLLALVFVVLLAALVVEFSYEAQVETARISASLNRFRASIAAESAVASGMSMLVADLMDVEEGATARRVSTSGDTANLLGDTYDGFDEPWAVGTPFTMINEAAMQCTITDEFGKINLNALLSRNTAEPNDALVEALRLLFEARGATEDPVDAILDWVDPDDEDVGVGAELGYYETLDVPYMTKNGPFGSVDELLLVRGISLDVFFGDPELDQLPLTELLTVYGHPDGRININTAQYEVLDAIGQAIGQGSLADTVIEERETAPFVDEQDLVLRGIAPKPDPEKPTAGTFDVQSNCYRIRGHGLAGESKVRIDAYVWRDERQPSAPIRVLDWRVLQ